VQLTRSELTSSSSCVAKLKKRNSQLNKASEKE
jgi:hypothetical protein